MFVVDLFIGQELSVVNIYLYLNPNLGIFVPAKRKKPCPRNWTHAKISCHTVLWNSFIAPATKLRVDILEQSSGITPRQWRFIAKGEGAFRAWRCFSFYWHQFLLIFVSVVCPLYGRQRLVWIQANWFCNHRIWFLDWLLLQMVPAILVRGSYDWSWYNGNIINLYPTEQCSGCSTLPNKKKYRPQTHI